MVVSFKKAFLVVGCISVFSCSNTVHVEEHALNDTIDVNDTRTVEYTADTNWTCVDVQRDYVCYPKEWAVMDQPECLFASPLSDEDPHTIFVVFRFDTIRSKRSLVSYIKEMYQSVKVMEGIKLLETNFLEIIYKDGTTAYTGDIYTQVKGRNYTSSGMLMVHNGMLYDISLQYPSVDSNRYRTIFEKIIVSYKSEGQHIFADKRMNKLIQVDISKL